MQINRKDGYQGQTNDNKHITKTPTGIKQPPRAINNKHSQQRNGLSFRRKRALPQHNYNV